MHGLTGEEEAAKGRLGQRGACVFRVERGIADRMREKTARVLG